MNYLQLYLYTRKGCCLCQGLEERIRELPLESLVHPLKLNILDIDSKDIKNANKLGYKIKLLGFSEILNNNLSHKYKIKKISHYGWKVNQEKYKEKVWEQLNLK